MDKKCNLGDGEGLQVSFSLQITEQTKFNSVLKQQIDVMK